MTALNIQNAPAQSGYHNLKGTIRLECGELYFLPYGTQHIRILSGTAWITSETEDHTLEAGERLLIARHLRVFIVSAVGQQPLTFAFLRL